jgi:hypothetical protein
MTTKALLAASLLLLAGCATSALEPLLMDGKELHASLTTQKLTDAAMLQSPREGLRDIPYVSTDARFVAGIARNSSQGRLGPEGIRAALFAQYLGESWLGFYGLEAASTADADRREVSLREIWAYGEGLGRARVHRKGNVLLVVWHGGVSPEVWEAVNARLAERLTAP